MKALDESEEVFHQLQAKRQNSFTQLYDVAIELESKLDVDVRIPRVLGEGKQHRWSNAPSQSVAEHFRINLHNAFLDHLIKEIQTRLLNANDRLQASQSSTTSECQLHDRFSMEKN
jgi:hypothetical protein